MARVLVFSRGEEVVIPKLEGFEPAFCILREGWLEVRSGEGAEKSYILGPGSVVAELGFFAARKRFRGVVRARTDASIEIVDRGLLTRWIGASGARLVPVLWALARRLEDALLEDEGVSYEDDTVVAWASIAGGDEHTHAAMGGRPVLVDRLPFAVGAYRIPQSVSDLFRPAQFPDLMLAGEPRMVRPVHLVFELDESGKLFLRVLHFGDWCEVDGSNIGKRRTPGIALAPGVHEVRFGDPDSPFFFRIRVFR